MTQGLQTRRRRRSELNLVPLIDVLVILVFFSFVTMQFRTPAALNITLPRVDTAGSNAFEGAVIISVDREGVMNFGTDKFPARAVVADELEPLLLKVREGSRDIPVLIRADEDTPLKHLAFVMDACRKAGLNKFSLQSR